MSKILLIGEYSKLHNSLKIGLEDLGHQVTLVGTGDRFKNFPVDYSYKPLLTAENSIFKWLNKICIKLFHWNLEATEKGIRFYFILNQLKGHDLVQLINSDALETHPKWSLFLLKKLFKQNKKVALLMCGDDTPIVDYQLQDRLNYSVLTPYLKGVLPAAKFDYVLKYTRPAYRKLYHFVSTQASCMIASDLDYHLPLKALKIAHHFIPNPVVLSQPLPQPPAIGGKVIIFLGINRLSAHKKGISFFETALERLQKRYPDTIEVLITENLPYREYIARYQQAHIILDMIYAYDQGYNALEAMAQGKVVFTGAEEEFWQHYKLPKNSICINALPDVEAITEELVKLIEQPENITKIGCAAQKFIAAHHDHIDIAQRYLKTWKLN